MKGLASALRWLVVVLAVLQGGYMLLDATVAIVTGDYITPRSGEYAGQLGPWSGVVSAIGLAPRGAPMKAVFVAYGLAWLVVAAGTAARRRWVRSTGVILAVGTLWYLVAGAIVSLVVLVILLLPAIRRQLTG